MIEMKIKEAVRTVKQTVVVTPAPLTLPNVERALVAANAYRETCGLRRTILHYSVEDSSAARAIREEFGSAIRIKPCTDVKGGAWAIEVLSDLESEDTLVDLLNPFYGE